MSSSTASSTIAGSFACYSSSSASTFYSSSSTSSSSSSSTSTTSSTSTKWEFPRTIENYFSQFPETIIDRYSKSYPYSSSEGLLGLISEIARCISGIYARFLTEKQGHKNVEGLIFKGIPTSFPKPNDVEKFQKRLCERLISEITSSQLTKLFVKHLPEGMLDEVLKECGFSDDYPDFQYFFPRNTLVSISRFKENKISIHMRSG